VVSDGPKVGQWKTWVLASVSEILHYPSDERAVNQMGKSIGALAVQRDRLNR
jgi:hypothetical protein